MQRKLKFSKQVNAFEACCIVGWGIYICFLTGEIGIGVWVGIMLISSPSFYRNSLQISLLK